MIAIVPAYYFMLAVRKFTSMFPKLVEGLKSNVSTVADHCLSAGLISTETYDTITECNIPKADKTRLLLRNISSTISLHPTSFHLFTSVLKDVGGYDDLVAQLEKTTE